jgi:hypothetical protein
LDRDKILNMLAFDLETTGLDPRDCLITCAAVCDPDAGLERVFFFARLGVDGRLVPLLDDAEEFMLLLDRADRLCAFNGARFDLPFIQHVLGADPVRVSAWRLKLHDVRMEMSPVSLIFLDVFFAAAHVVIEPSKWLPVCGYAHVANLEKIIL